MTETDISKITGFLICYTGKDEMDKVHARLKDLGMKDVVISRAFNTNEVPYPFTLALLVRDELKFRELDDFLTDSQIDLGNENEIYAGRPRVQEFFRMIPLDGKIISGIVKLSTRTCPRDPDNINPLSCTFCPTGHMLECHYPLDCQQAQCSHLWKYRE